MVSETVSAMYARKNFGQILDKAALLDKSYVIERSGKPMAALVPLSSLEETEIPVDDINAVLENLIKKIKSPRSKKLDKAILKARKFVASLQG